MIDADDLSWGVNFEAPSRYRRNLPHWRQEGAVYFVTFRLADSIPRAIVEAWIEDRRAWMEAHGISEALDVVERQQRYFTVPEEVRRAFERDEARRYFVELDRCHGACWLRRADAARLVAEALRFHHEVRLRCGDFVVMPNHVHWLLLPLPGHELEAILRSVKQWTAMRINRIVGRSGRFWKKESFDHIVRSPQQFARQRNYIEQNPAKARLRPGEFLHYRADWI